MRVPGRSLITWLHLAAVAIALLLLSTARALITGFYRIFPFKPLLDAAYLRSQPLRNLFSLRLAGAPSDKSHAMTAPQLIEAAGYPVEVHHCITKDGVVIGLHRIPHGVNRTPVPRGAAMCEQGGVCATPPAGGVQRVQHMVGARPVTPGTLGASRGRPAVLLIHGLMMCSDVWVVSGRERSLAFALVDAGYDVFLGNNRGNRYSSKHTRLNCRDRAFWNFSIDELARFDVPAMVDYVLKATGQRQCAIIGFSQGTAQTFAALSQDQLLTTKVSAFVALSPAVCVKGLSRSAVAALVSANENFIYLLFGRRRIFPSTLVWQRIMSTKFYVRVIDASLRYLFSWDVANISDARKPLLYNHIYSYSSVKSVVHWFQIIRSGRFQMFDDAPSSHRVPPMYDVRNITTVPVALFVGGKDTIIDPPRLISLLPPTTVVHHLPTYEHLCPMWSETAHVDVYPHVIAHLNRHCRGTPQVEVEASWASGEDVGAAMGGGSLDGTDVRLAPVPLRRRLSSAGSAISMDGAGDTSGPAPVAASRVEGGSSAGVRARGPGKASSGAAASVRGRTTSSSERACDDRERH